MKFSHAFFKRPLIFVQLILIALVSISTISAQTSSVDSSFNAVIAKEVGFSNFTLQPDGKILTFGNFQIVNGVIKNQIARLNVDGSLDNSFDCTACDFNVGSVVVQPDGKIVAAGSVYSTANQTSAARVKRLNADGSLDASFNSPYNSPPAPMFQGSTSAVVWAFQPNGKILVTITTSSGGNTGQSLYRLNTDGSLDNSFSTINFQPGRNLFQLASKIAVSNSGKIFIVTAQPTYGITSSVNRYNSDGTPDTTFESPTITGNAGSFGNGYRINDFKILSDESVVIVGYFNTVNALNRVNIAKLLPAGNVDLSFAPSNVYLPNEAAVAVDIFSNGKILVRSGTGTINTPIQPPPPRFIRYNTDGSVDNMFIAPANLTTVSKFVIDSSDNVLLYGGFTENGMPVSKFARLNMNGALISSFVVNYGIGGTVTKVAVQADGKVIIAGDFTQIGGITRKNFARLNTDGSLDQTFNPGTGFDNTVEKIVVLPDGKILVGGSFANYNGTARNALVRLNADSSLDTSFNANIAEGGNVYSIDLQADGKILIGGSFLSVNGQTRSSIARLNADGSLDASFNPIIGGSFPVIRRVLVQPDGKIVIGGSFSGVNGFARTNLARLNADGSLDASFNAGNFSAVTIVERQPDGKYLIVASSALIRLNIDGTTDASFTVANSSGINAVLIQPDGSIIVGGDFTFIGGTARQRLVRLTSNGTVDPLFFPTGADNPIFAIDRQADGKLIIGGSFTTIENVTRLGVARLIVAPVRARVKPYDYDGDGRADLAVFRPANGVWYVLSSQNNTFSGVQFGSAGDKIAPADYDGDGKTDLAVFRENIAAASTGAFYILYSSDNSFHPVAFGSTGDVPVSGDWDGDGIGDPAVYRDGSLTGGSSLFIYRPSSQPGVDFRVISWGAAGDKPVVGDYDGDGKLDAAIFRPSIAQWYVLRSSNNQFFNVQFGNSTDIPAPADYTGDGKTDVGVFRPSNGSWYYSSSQTTPSTSFTGIQFGSAGDLPVPADYDGDGKADVAVFRPSNGIWYLQRSTAGFTGVQFGASGDKPAENAYVR